MSGVKCAFCHKDMRVTVLACIPPITRYECDCGRRIDEKKSEGFIYK